jgi:hypothetical protein
MQLHYVQISGDDSIAVAVSLDIGDGAFQLSGLKAPSSAPLGYTH